MTPQFSQYSMPACRVYNNANIAIPTGVSTPLTFNTERYDTNAMHDTAVNPGRITIPVAGIYTVGFLAQFEGSALGTFRIWSLRVNGVTFIAQELVPPVPSAAIATATPCISTYKFAAGDYIEAFVKHDAGVAKNIIYAPDTSPEFYATWERP